jgi:tetratricopeptide (TPR) repeat protein
MGLGTALDCQGRAQEALEAFDQAIARFPADDGARAFRAAQYFNLRRYSEAADDAISSLELKPDNRHALWVMSNLAAVDATGLAAKLKAKQAADTAHADYWASLINQFTPAP